MMCFLEAAGETAHFALYLEYLPLHPNLHSFFAEMVDNAFPLGRI